MKHRITLFTALLFTAIGLNAQVTIVDFEVDGVGYTPSTTGGSSFIDVFNRINDDLAGVTNEDGYYWAMEDFDGDPSLQLDQIDISSATAFTFSIDLLAHHYLDWDTTDELLITYSVDGGAYQNLMWVQSIPDGDIYNSLAAVDSDFDGDGECENKLPAITQGENAGCTVSSSNFETFSTSSIPVSGSTLDIILQFNGLTATDEGIYLDNITISQESGTPTPIITTSPSGLSGFTYEEGSGPSTSQSFDVSGNNLTADITVTPSTNYVISSDNSTFQSTAITLTQSGGSVPATTLYARLKAGLSAGDYNESIVCSSTDATDKNMSVSGSVTLPPQSVSTLSALRAGTDDNSTIYTFTGEAFVQAINSYNGQKYIQDATGGILIYDASGNITTSFSQGDCMTGITGTLTTSNGMLRFIPSADASLVGSPSSAQPAAQVITVDEFNTNFADYEAELIQIVSVTFSSTGTFQNGSNYDFSDASASAVMRTDIWNVDFINSAIPTIPGSITGVALEYNGTAQIVARSSADLVFIAETPTIVVDPSALSNLSYTEGNGPSTSQMISVSGSALEGNITVTPPSNFEISEDNSAFQTTAITLTPTDGAVSGSIYVRLVSGLAIDTYTGDITLSSSGASSQTVSLDGEVTEEVELADFVLINEIDADNVETDDAEFIELYDGGVGNTALDGLVIVLFNGSDDQSYDAIDLDGYSTDANGYFVIGSALVPNVDYDYFTTNGLQNGADAVALIVGDAADYPNDTPIPAASSIQDAVVYDTSDSDDVGLLTLLNVDEPQLDENAWGNKDDVSLGRWTDGAGGKRNTSTYEICWPTPGGPNNYGVATSVETPVAQINVFGGNNSIIIESGVAPVSIYGLDGKLVFQGTTLNSRTEISIERQGIYFVRVKDTTAKVIVR